MSSATVSGKLIVLVALAIFLLGLLLVMPSRQRWQKLSRAILLVQLARMA